MGKCLYLRLAASNLKKNGRLYLPYLIASSATVMFCFILGSLTLNSRIYEMPGGAILAVMLALGTIIACIFGAVLLFYINGFLVRQRKKEFGLLIILGMEKRHLGRIQFYETLFSAVISIGAGLVFGALLSQLMFLILLRLVGAGPQFSFELQPMMACSIAAVFGVVFLAVLLNNLRQVHFANPVELLRGGQVAEREPKTRWPLVLVGLASLGGGYAISLLVQSPINAILLFFVAVLLVILGTYCLFMAGSTAVLKCMRSRKGFYYKPNHFISVSGLLYRMRQNANGLSNICILSTMVLVTVSTTVALYIGMDEVSHSLYPRMLSIAYTDAKAAEVTDAVDRVLDRYGLAPQNVQRYHQLKVSALREGDSFSTDVRPDVNYDNVGVLAFFLADELKSITGQEVPLSLGPDQVLIQGELNGPIGDTFTFAGKTWQVVRPDGILPKGMTLNDMVAGEADISAVQRIAVVLPDLAAMQAINEAQKAAYGEYASDIVNQYLFDVQLEAPARRLALYQSMKAELVDTGLLGRMNVGCRDDFVEGSLALYGGFFFLGIFLGSLFLMATVLIIYYKQVSEGYEDRRRFAIMQQVGMSRQEVWAAVRTQVLTMFFLPLGTAFIHLAFAFPTISRMLRVFSLYNVELFLVCTLACAGVFAVIYAMVYFITARTYYRIVGEPNRA